MTSQLTPLIRAGLPPAWLQAGGVAVKDLRTPYGALSYSLQEHKHQVILRISADTGMPPGGFVLVWSGAQPPGATRINGQSALWRGSELSIHELPATVVVNAR